MNLLLFRHSNVKQTKGNRSQLWACLVCMLNAVHISATYNATPRYTQRKKFPRRAFAEQNENLSNCPQTNYVHHYFFALF